MKLTILLIALAVSGCASWSHPTKSPDQFYSDLNDCERDFAAMQDPLQAFYAKRRCLMVKGWRD